jgi:hypothetical protein
MAVENASATKNGDFNAVDFDELEKFLDDKLQQELSDLDFLEKENDKFGTPEDLGGVVLNSIWEQFTNQISVQAGEDFIKENNGLTLDLRNEAHIQTTENFANGNIATHNTEIDYKERYDKWQSKFQKDSNGNVVTHTTRTGKHEATLAKGARKPFDESRPHGNKNIHTDMDHTVSASEIIRDPAANAHLTEEEQIAFANSYDNLNEMDSGMNRSKGDKSMSDWLNNPNSKGKKPDEIFDISGEEKKKLMSKDKQARKKYEKEKKEGEIRSVESGKRSQREEAFRIGNKALRAIVMNLLAELAKNVIRKLVSWFRLKEKSLNNLIESIKTAVHSFILNLKEYVVNTLDTALTVILTAIIGPIVGVIKKTWMLLKQGWKSIKEAISYIKNPENKNKPASILTMEIGKILIAGTTAVGAIALGEAIEKGLFAIPVFAIEIPLFGSLASIVGLFMGALISGIIGALAIELINRLIAKKLKQNNVQQRIDKKNEILKIQSKIVDLQIKKTEMIKTNTIKSISERHAQIEKKMRQSFQNIYNNPNKCNDDDFEEINRRIDLLLDKKDS